MTWTAEDILGNNKPISKVDVPWKSMPGSVIGAALSTPRVKSRSPGEV
jgi:hypothetical protein